MPGRRDFRNFLRRATGRRLKAESPAESAAPDYGQIPDGSSSTGSTGATTESAPATSAPRSSTSTSRRLDIYSPLDETRREIRPCRILPFSFNQESISCNLEIVLLNADPNFEALSYVWGDAREHIPIIVNGKRLLVSENLAAAIRDLSSRAMARPGGPHDFSRVVWIDAICIDQTNMAERNSQVRLMGDIYNTARQVISWLGPGFQNQMNYINTHMSAYLKRRDASVLSDVVRFGDMVGPAERIILRMVPLLMGTHILDSSQKAYNYWHRVWTAQEVVKAKRVILQSGMGELPLEYVQEFHKYITSTASANNPLLLSQIIHDTTVDTAPTDASAPLLDVLIRFAYRHCADPRDKIYGLLGISDLAGSSHPGLKIDYSSASTPRTVYVGAVHAIVDTTKSLDVIVQSRPRLTPPEYNLPSWTPSWTPQPEDAPPSAIIRPPTDETPWRAGGSGPATATFSTSGSHDILSSPGIIFGRVTAVSSRVFVDLDNVNITQINSTLHFHLTQNLAKAYNELVDKIPAPSEPPINFWSTLNPLYPPFIDVTCLRQDLFIFCTPNTSKEIGGSFRQRRTSTRRATPGRSCTRIYSISMLVT